MKNFFGITLQMGVFLVLYGMAACAWGQPVSVLNPSFESGADAPDGWHLTGGEGAWVEDAPDGSRAISVTGTAQSQASSCWQSEPLVFEPKTVYRLSFQARRLGGTSGSPVSGPAFCNRDLHEITNDWQRYTSFFVAPAAGTESPIRLGQWEADGAILFDDISLVRAYPIYRRSGTVILGEGESIRGKEYAFIAPLAGQSANHGRPLLRHTCFFNKPRWCFSKDSAIVYAHQVGEETQLSGEIEVNIGYHTHGMITAEASRNSGEEWLPVGTIDKEGTLSATLPEALFPASAIAVRFRGAPAAGSSDESVDLQVHGYTYRSMLERSPGDMQGETHFMAVAESDGNVKVDYDDLAETIPGRANELKFRATNMTWEPITIQPRLRIVADGSSAEAVSPAPIILPPLSLKELNMPGIEVSLPYDIPGTGEIALTLNLGDAVRYRAETNFTVSCLHESRYGHALPGSSEDVALWWASSGWKVSRSRPVPKDASKAVRIQLARNECEAAQFVLRPGKPLNAFEARPQPLQGPNGAQIPEAAIELLRVGYVPVMLPTDGMGATAPWPDPLPPLDSPVNLGANENQPVWVRVHTAPDTPPGEYSGVILLQAEGWRGEVPLAVEVFDFALPDRKTCVSAFGFDAALAFRYHNAIAEADRRIVLDNYLSLLSDHHISIYNPAFLDPLKYDWPNLPLWRGGTGVTEPSNTDGPCLLLQDDSTTANVSALYDKLLPLPMDGMRIAIRYKTGESGHAFIVTVLHYDASGQWMEGLNNDMEVKGDGNWQSFETTVNTFPEGTNQFMLRLWATHYTETGEPTGMVWFDDVTVSGLASETPLIQEDFSLYDREHIESRFVPEFDWTNWDAAMTRAFEYYHFNSFSLPVPGLGGGTFHARFEPELLGYGEGTWEYQAAFTAWCQAAEAHLREKGWLDDAFIYWFDEPEPRDYDFVINGFRKLKEAAPGLNRMLTEEVNPELIGGPNIWCPISFNYNAEEARKRQAEGEKIWWYICTGPKAPYATLFIDHPATELRVWLWQTWERSIDGILIWQSNYWTSDEAYPDTPQNPYEDPMGWTTGYSTPVGARRPWGNGDGRFLYPPLAAADGIPAQTVHDAPVGSIRLDMLRDGIEDYEYLVILRRLLQGTEMMAPAPDSAQYKPLLEVPQSISKTLTEFTQTPAPIEAQREAIARAIMALGALNNRSGN